MSIFLAVYVRTNKIPCKCTIKNVAKNKGHSFRSGPFTVINMGELSSYFDQLYYLALGALYDFRVICSAAVVMANLECAV